MKPVKWNRMSNLVVFEREISDGKPYFKVAETASS